MGAPVESGITHPPFGGNGAMGSQRRAIISGATFLQAIWIIVLKRHSPSLLEDILKHGA